MKLMVSILLMFLFIGDNSLAQIRVAAASSLRGPLEMIASQYEDLTGVKVDVIYGSSGKLTQQVEFAAPFDVFISANSKYTTYLFDEGLTIDPPIVLSKGHLAIWSSKNNLNEIYPTLTDPLFGKVAIPNPEFAPFGELAYRYLEEEDLKNRLIGKLVIGGNVTQVNQYINTQAVEMAFTSWSSKFQLTVEGYWKKLDKHFVFQSACVVLGTEQELKAKDFLGYLMKPISQKMLQEHGFEMALNK